MKRWPLPVMSTDRSALLALCGVVLGIAAGGVAAAIAASPSIGLTILVGLVVVSPVFVRLAQGKWDPFEPIQVMVVLCFIIFVVRPAAELIYGIDAFGDFQLTETGFNGALVTVLIGVLCLYGGYAVAAGERVAAKIRPLPTEWDVDRSVRFSIVLLLLAALLVGLFALTVGPHALFDFYLGRSATSSAVFNSTSPYVSFGSYLTIPAALMLLMAFRRKRSAKVGVLLAISIVAALFVVVPRGDRMYLFAFLFPVVVLWYLPRGRRPSGLAIVALMVIVILLTNVLLGARTVEARHGTGPSDRVTYAITHPLNELKTFATGVDLAEFTVLELEYQAHNRPADALPLHPGATIKSIVLGPLPLKVVGRENGESGLQFVNDFLFTRNNLPPVFGPSLFGDLYADYGWIAVALYSVLIGIALRVLWEYFLRQSHNEGMHIVFAAMLPMLVWLTRVDLPDTIARGFYFVFPVILGLVLCSKSRTDARAVRAVRPYATRVGSLRLDRSEP